MGSVLEASVSFKVSRWIHPPTRGLQLAEHTTGWIKGNSDSGIVVIIAQGGALEMISEIIVLNSVYVVQIYDNYPVHRGRIDKEVSLQYNDRCQKRKRRSSNSCSSSMLSQSIRFTQPIDWSMQSIFRINVSDTLMMKKCHSMPSYQRVVSLAAARGMAVFCPTSLTDNLYEVNTMLLGNFAGVRDPNQFARMVAEGVLACDDNRVSY